MAELNDRLPAPGDLVRTPKDIALVVGCWCESLESVIHCDIVLQPTHALVTRDNLSTLDAVHRLADEEKQSRLRSAVERRIRDARFPEINTVDAFDFDFDPARKKMRARYLALHDLAFLDKGVNPLFIGHPGTGKTFLARALAYKACTAAKRVVFVSAPRMLNDLHGAEIHGALERRLRRYTHADLLVVDDFAVLAMDAAQAKLAFPVISERYDYRRSTAVTTIDLSKTGPRSSPTLSTRRSSPSGSPSVPNASFSMERGFETHRQNPDRPPGCTAPISRSARVCASDSPRAPLPLATARRRTVPAPPGGHLDTGDPGDCGTLRRRR